jgi:hypothetical protein
MAARTHYTKPYLSLVETGKRSATVDVVSAYERVLGIGHLGDNVNRRDFLSVTGLAIANAKVVNELAASVASNDPGPLTTVQTTNQVDRALAAYVDQATIKHLRRWLDDGDDSVLRVNAAGILAKIPGQLEATRVVTALNHDVEMRDRYMTAVVSRICGLDWPTAASMVREPSSFPHPVLAAGRLAHEAVEAQDVGARWCSAAMLQGLSPTLGR